MTGKTTPVERDQADMRGVLAEVVRYRLMTRKLLLRVRAAPTEKRIRDALRRLEGHRWIDLTDAERRGGTDPTRTESMIWLTELGEGAAQAMEIEGAHGSDRKLGTRNEIDHRIAVVETHIALRVWAGDCLEEIWVDFEPGSGGRHKVTEIELGGQKIIPDAVAAVVFPGNDPQVVVLEVERGGRRADLSGFFKWKLPRLRKAAETRLVERRTNTRHRPRFMMVFPTRDVRDKALARWPDPASDIWGLFYVKALGDVTGPDFNGGWMHPGWDGTVSLFEAL